MLHTTHGHRPNPEVIAKPTRRTLTAEFKLYILRQADACTEPGQIGALPRREGLYSSQLAQWRAQHRQAEKQALTDHKRGRPAPDPLSAEVERLRKEKARLTKRLQQAEIMLEVQKKISSMLELPQSSGNDCWKRWNLSAIPYPLLFCVGLWG